MADYISRDAVNAEIGKRMFEFPKNKLEAAIDSKLQNLAQVVYGIPAADVRPVVKGEVA